MIFSQPEEKSTDDVQDWLYYYEIDAIRHNIDSLDIEFIQLGAASINTYEMWNLLMILEMKCSMPIQVIYRRQIFCRVMMEICFVIS
jgi:hypothetical protein